MKSIVAATLLVLATILPAQADPRPFTRGSWQSLVQAHAARPFAVHFWSLTCAPCLVELPRWHDMVKETGMDLILVSTDPAEDWPKVERTLKRAGLEKMESWAFADLFTERLRFEIDKTWHGELPMTVFVSASGERKAVTGTVTREDFASWLRSGQR
ncbi:putative signal peptide protein [Paramagnetospirillum magnetotacticum MS-1]|uniref:Putative signal peptide protein n=1 Tax=Paramagnetospirillum magnetotacticum MS-1 TaxID=272627 RepID=A0A0C2UA30_PARME|nr:thiol-disulfide isomerase [Paramagnetospirillum magnetotacticum]KIL98342.1 putative signal peptide protein [Paramagnetospirillum magnetotacticum MS-1]